MHSKRRTETCEKLIFDIIFSFRNVSETVEVHRLFYLFEISRSLALVPQLFRPDSYLTAAADEYDVFVYFGMRYKSFVKNYSAVGVGYAFLSNTEQELLDLQGYSLGQLLYFFNV